MSILNVEHLTHGFGDRAIFTDVSFRLLKGPCRVSGSECRVKAGDDDQGSSEISF